MLHPTLERPEFWWVFWLAHGIYVVVTYKALSELKKAGKCLTPWEQIAKLYVGPLLVLAAVHVFLVLFCDCDREWSALCRSAKPLPPAKNDSRELRPPPHGPPPSVVAVLLAAKNLVAKLLRAAAVFLLRLWIGPPLCIAAVVAVVAAIRHNPKGQKHVRIN